MSLHILAITQHTVTDSDYLRVEMGRDQKICICIVIKYSYLYNKDFIPVE